MKITKTYKWIIATIAVITYITLLVWKFPPVITGDMTKTTMDYNDLAVLAGIFIPGLIFASWFAMKKGK